LTKCNHQFIFSIVPVNNFTNKGLKKVSNRKVKALLVEAGIKQKSLAREAGVCEGLVSLVIAGQRKTGPDAIRVRKLIALALGMRVEQLWPRSNGKRAA
jgi:lambda repressor-like predicted transcriptional regulator